MATKNIAINFKKKKHLLDYAGIWEEVSENEWKEFEKSVKAARSGLHDSMKKSINKYL